jgi:uncharacterized Zn finger protein
MDIKHNKTEAPLKKILIVIEREDKIPLYLHECKEDLQVEFSKYTSFKRDDLIKLENKNFRVQDVTFIQYDEIKGISRAKENTITSTYYEIQIILNLEEQL